MPPKRKIPSSPSSSDGKSKLRKDGKQTALGFGKLGSVEGSGGGTVGKAKKPMKGLSGFINAFQTQSVNPPSPPIAGPSTNSLSAYQTNGKGKGKAKAKDQDVIDIEESSDGDKNVKMIASQDGDEKSQMQMWTELYCPESSVDLAPTKQRITAVRNWLEEATSGIPAGLDKDVEFSVEARNRTRKYRRILILSGPAGVGKTTTIRVLAKELGIQLVEWSEGVEEWSIGGLDTREGLTSKMLSFFSRNRYESLSLGDQTLSSQNGSSPATRRLLLLSSLPNLSSPSVRQAFQTALLDYAASYTSASCPLVIIVSDAGSAGRAETSWVDRLDDAEWDVRSVVGKGLMGHPAVNMVDFLAMAPTFITKALKRIIPLAFPVPSTRPSNDTLQLIAGTSNGDLRSAINSLQFMSHGSGTELSKPADGPKKKGKGSRGGAGGKISGSKSLRAILDAVSRREQSLGLFHALGKILYNKRIGDEGEVQEVLMLEHERLPPHLAHFERREYENEFEDLLASIPVDTSTFALWIHQNIPQYCTDVDQMQLILDDLCKADTMKADDDLWQRTSHAILYAFHVMIRGTVMGLPSPVPRMGQKTYKPDFFNWHKVGKEKNVALRDVSNWYERMLIGKAQAETSETAEDSKWSGQLSDEAFVLDVLPFLRLSQQAALSSDGMMTHLESLRLPAFHHPAYATHANDLEQLTEKEDRFAPDEDDAPDDLDSVLQQRKTSDDQLGEEEAAAPTWLDDDDIDEF